MESSSAIVEWIAATGLRPFLEALDSEKKRKRFVELLSERVAEAYLVRNDGQVLFPFRRTFVIAYA
jgi:trans-aconitate 2-methyltransferase